MTRLRVADSQSLPGRPRPRNKEVVTAMNLPRNEIGITDVLEWRRCPARFAYGMRRHVELPKELQLEPGEKDNPTEATNENNAYGSCIHDAIGIVEREAVTDEEAISRAFPRYARWLNPEDADLLREDLKTYHRRRPLGVTLVASERDLRVPLFVHNGVQIYFRFKDTQRPATVGVQLRGP